METDLTNLVASQFDRLQQQLALVNSYQLKSTCDPNTSRLYRLIIELEDPTYNTGRFAYFMQMLGQIFCNQQQLEPARKMWHRAIAFSQSSHYTQTSCQSRKILNDVKYIHLCLSQSSINDILSGNY
jgi:hypothetical protein